MKRFLTTAAGLLALVPSSAQIKCDIGGEKVPWIGTFPSEIGANYRFAVLPDRTGGAERGVFRDAMDEVNALAPDFVINVGDLIDGYVSDLSFSAAQWDEALGIVGKLDAPLFLVGGNHDLSNKLLKEDWINRFGRTYYHFTVSKDLFLILDTEENGDGSLSREQIEYFKPLIESFDGRWIYVFMHRSLWIKQNGGFAEIAALLKGRGHTVISGHEHAYYMEERDGMKYIQVATLGGSSQMRGIHVGEFDHILFVTAKDGGPVIANLSAGGQLPLDIVSPKTWPYVSTLTRQSYASIKPVMLDGDLQKKFTLTLCVTNPCDSDMQFTADSPEMDEYSFSPEHIETTIRPHGSQTFDIIATNRNMILSAEMPEIWIKTSCGYIMDGDLVTLPSWKRVLLDWPHKVPCHIECKHPDYVKEGWDWHSLDDGWFSFDINVRRNKLVISVRMHDDVKISPDSQDSAKPYDKVCISLQSGGKDYSWTLTSDGEVTLPMKKIKGKTFLFNINFTDSDNAHNIKPSVLWWRKAPVPFTL